jgi:hypothetical protein
MHRRVLCVPRNKFQSKILFAVILGMADYSGTKNGKNVASRDEADSWRLLADNLTLVYSVSTGVV